MNANVRVLPDLLIVESNLPEMRQHATEAVRELCLTGWVEKVTGYKTHPGGVHYPLVEEIQPSYAVAGYSYEECHVSRVAKNGRVTFYVMGLKAGEIVTEAKNINAANAEQLEKERAYLLDVWNVQLNNLRVRWQGIIPVAVQRRQNSKAAWEPEEEFFPDQEKVSTSDMEYAVATLKRIASTSNVAKVYNFPDVNLSWIAVADLAVLANMSPSQILHFYSDSLWGQPPGMVAIKNDPNASGVGFESGTLAFTPAAWAEQFLAALHEDYEGIVLEMIPIDKRHTSAHFLQNRELVGKYYHGAGLSYLLVFV